MFDFLQTYIQYPIQTAMHELWGVIVALFCLTALFTDSIARSIACIGIAFLITYDFISYEHNEFLRIHDLVEKDIANMIFLFIVTLFLGLFIKKVGPIIMEFLAPREPLIDITPESRKKKEEKDVRDQ